MGKIIGIDLGTTNSCVSVMEGDTYKILTNAEGGRTTPSVIALTKDGDVLVGEPAKRQAVTNPTDTLYGIKRLIGRRFDDPAVQEMKENAGYKIVEGPNGDAWVEFGGKACSPAEISAKVLSKLKQVAEDYLGEEVTEAVVTVPAYFNDAQRQATKDAGKIAGLDVKRIINEPTAAALAYGLEGNKDGKVIVYDLGGGTFDVSVLEIDDGAFEVLATNGDTFLGGENFDEVLIDYIADTFQKENDVDLRKDPTALQRLKEAAEKAKIELSGRTSTEINLPFIGFKDGAPLNLQMNLTRSKFENLVSELVERTIKPCEQAMADAGISKDDIDQVLLVGGMTRMPKIQEIVTSFFGKEPSKGVNPDEVVSAGAGVQGGILSGDVKDILLLDVTPLSLGLRLSDGTFHKIIEKNTTIPTTGKDEFSTSSDNQTSVFVQVAQGERPMYDENNQIGEVELDGILPAPAGMPKIQVEFNINADGVLTVTATDLGTKKAVNAKLKADGGLSDAQVEAMIKDAEANKEKDAERREFASLTNKAEADIPAAEKELEQYGEQLGEDAKSAFETAIADMKAALESDDKDLNTLRTTFQALSEARSGIGAAIYGQNQASDDASAEGDQPENAPQAPEAANDAGTEEPTPAQPAQKAGKGTPKP